VRLVKEGFLAKLWRAANTTRGGGAVASVLPVLALHTWPEKQEATDGWTGWSYLSRRRVARLTGVNKGTTTAAFRQLVSAGLMQMERCPRAKYEGGYKTYYHLTASLYPQDDEPYATIPARLFYGGTWFFLPSPACRHLYMVLACLDPIGDEEAYLERIADDIGDEWDRVSDEEDEALEDEEERKPAVQAKILAERRESAPLSVSEMVRDAGLQRSTVIEARQVLITGIFNWLQVLGTTELSQINQRVRHQLHAIVPLLDAFKS
jgi:hypothetical protein